MEIEQKDDNIYDVIIIGAGLSGLSSGYYLKKKCKDLNLLIIEAKETVGGRTKTIELKSDKSGKKAKWDIGSQWVSSSQTYINELIKEFNLETYKQNTNGKKILEVNGKISSYNLSIPRISIFSLFDLKCIIGKYNIGSRRLNTIYPFENIHLAAHLDSINLDQYLYSNSLSTKARAIVESSIRFIYGFESTQLNALFALLIGKSNGGSFETLALCDKDCAQESRIVNGAQQISEKLLESIFNLSDGKKITKIIFNTQLIEIIQNKYELNEPCVVITHNTVSGVKEKFKCKKIISSIPINQYVHVNFKPELPFYKRNFYKFCQYGNYTKYIVTYETPFWRDKGLSGEVISDGSVININDEVFREIYDTKYNDISFNKQAPTLGPITCIFDGTTHDGNAALICFSASKQSLEWSDQDIYIRKQEILQALVRYFGNEAKNYVDFAERNWSNEAFSGGCPTIGISAGGIMHDFARATREPYLNVHFCGSESATQWQGQMDGAVESGSRAANEVIYSLYGNFNSIKIDYDNTYFHQKKFIENINYKNNSYKFKLSLSLVAKYFIYFVLFSLLAYIYIVYFYI